MTLFKVGSDRKKVTTFPEKLTQFITKDLKSIHRLDLILDTINEFFEADYVKEEDVQWFRDL